MRATTLVVLLLALAYGAPAEITLNGRRVDRDGSACDRQLCVLFIGNSLTYWNEMPWMAEQVAKSLKLEPALHADSSVRGGASLRYHWEKGRAVRAIREKRYAYVVLQPQSSEIMNEPDETLRYAKLLDEEIRRSGAKTIIFQTWAPRGSQHSQAAYNARYQQLARTLGASIAPVGAAFDAMEAQQLTMIDSSNVHASLAGSYLSACVFVATLYGRSPAGAMHTFDVKYDIKEVSRDELETKRLSASEARALQEAAWLAVRNERRIVSR